MSFSAEDLLRILLAVLAGGLIGLEREFRDKAAGFRTLIFICMGAALFTILSAKLTTDDPTRIAANIVSGVGFLGAGVILRDGGRVVGLTTAAAVWLTAALGMALGGGQYLLGFGVLIVSLVVLWIFPFLEHLVDNTREERRYQVICLRDHEKVTQLERLLLESGLKIRERHQIKSGEQVTYTWATTGPLTAHTRVVDALTADPDVHEFRF
jgi:putative Mg2+ transporter-C (MgtC) family protein